MNHPMGERIGGALLMFWLCLETTRTVTENMNGAQADRCVYGITHHA